MGVLDELLKLGYKVSQDIKPETAEKLLLLAKEGKLPSMKPKNLRPLAEAEDFGKTILTDPELAEAQLQRNVLRKEKLQNPPKIEEPPPKKPTSLKEMMADLERIKTEKAKTTGVAGMAALGMPDNETVNMSPLPYLKKGYEGYKTLKDKIFGAAAEQMDLTKDRSATEGIKNTLDLVADPVNYIPGGVGMALGGLQTGLELLPNEDETKKNKFERLRETLRPSGRKPSGNLP